MAQPAPCMLPGSLPAACCAPAGRAPGWTRRVAWCPAAPARGPPPAGRWRTACRCRLQGASRQARMGRQQAREQGRVEHRSQQTAAHRLVAPTPPQPLPGPCPFPAQPAPRPPFRLAMGSWMVTPSGTPWEPSTRSCRPDMDQSVWYAVTPPKRSGAFTLIVLDASCLPSRSVTAGAQQARAPARSKGASHCWAATCWPSCHAPAGAVCCTSQPFRPACARRLPTSTTAPHVWAAAGHPI